ncbi:MAG TPA: hypothetical protein VHA52_00275, partial [Candidatus Babeliaceae bacterium]|nr:hypothetical protein [Candidatus Babeliaceae bacterium]
ASETPQLKGKNLVPYLIEIDQNEYPVLQSEDNELKELQNEWRCVNIGKITSMGLGILSFFGAFYYSSDLYAKAGRWMMSGTIFTLAGAVAQKQYSDTLEAKIKELYNRRLLRFEDKIRKLENRITSIAEPLEREQLEQARDFFKLHFQHFQAKAINNIAVTVKTYSY